ncbi:unnamed protein product [Trypanosoma congolense IL3000]|uniref:Hexosyltransferase n=1 Tax=Trypanosoma congolense (strain IL3000) TaxID=1068625 RepID=F9WIT5_TRYCI|nr:unnamed protein product [Trypanosoma congolense IL3000]
MAKNVRMRVMQKPRRPTGKLLLLCAGIVSLIIILCVLWGTSGCQPNTATEKDSLTPINYDTYLRFIPPDVVSTWKAREFLVVMGIPSVDIDARQRRRDLQRETCWQYNGVARQRNNFTGELLPLYLLAPHQSNGYEISESLWKEATKSHDVVILPTSDVRPSTRRRIGEGGSWGFQSEVVMSRKTYLWLQFALHMFPNASYIVKGDDDMFMHVPQYLADLRVMPRRGLYMGRMYRASLLWTTDDIVFAAGYCTTLSKDAAQAVVSYKPLAALLSKPYSIWHMMQYSSMSVMHEDIMVGRVLREKIKLDNLITIDVGRCRFHDVPNKTKVYLTNNSVVLHHIGELHYFKLLRHFPTNATPPAPSPIRWVNGYTAILPCP